MISLPQLRHTFAAALAATLLVILMAGFVMPNGVIVCGPPGYHVALPRPARARFWRTSETDLSISVQRDGTLLIGNLIVPASDFPSQLRALHQRTPGRRIVLRPDRRSPFGATRLVLRGVQSLGIHTVVIDGGMQSVADAWSR